MKGILMVRGKEDRAERQKRTKESGIRQTLFARLSSPLLSCLSELKWKLFMATIAIKLRWWEAKEESIRKRLCAKGFHKVVRMVHSFTSDEKTLSVEYLRCLYCDFAFFSTIKDKRTYLALTSSHRKSVKNMWKELK